MCSRSGEVLSRRGAGAWGGKPVLTRQLCQTEPCAMAGAFSRSLTVSVWFSCLARSKAVWRHCDRERGEVGGGGVKAAGGRRKRAGAGRRGEPARRLHKAPPPHPLRPSPRPQTLPSSALCATTHLVLEARVGPRLKQRLDAACVAIESRLVQHRHLALPRRGGGPTHAGERRRRAAGRPHTP